MWWLVFMLALIGWLVLREAKRMRCEREQVSQAWLRSFWRRGGES